MSVAGERRGPRQRWVTCGPGPICPAELGPHQAPGMAGRWWGGHSDEGGSALWGAGGGLRLSRHTHRQTHPNTDPATSSVGSCNLNHPHTLAWRGRPSGTEPGQASLSKPVWNYFPEASGLPAAPTPQSPSCGPPDPRSQTPPTPAACSPLPHAACAPAQHRTQAPLPAAGPWSSRGRRSTPPGSPAAPSRDTREGCQVGPGGPAGR